MEPRATRVGVVQFTSTAAVEQNLHAVERTVRKAVLEGAEVVLVPESFAYLGPESGKFAVAESIEDGGPVLDRMKSLAKETGAHLVLGGHIERGHRHTHVRNASVHLDPHGEVKAVYRKIHLFDVDLPDGTHLLESDTVEAGTEIVASDMPFGKLGHSICYDLRFPELYRQLVDRGAIALAVPSAFTLTTGKDHWHVLLRARAIEQQSYVLAAAQTGKHHGSRQSYGHAMIVDPWGTILAQVGEGEGTAVATVDPHVVQKVRRSLPSLVHRKLG